MRFLSAVSWVERHGVMVEDFMGGSTPSLSRREQRLGLVICDDFDLSYLPEPSVDQLADHCSRVFLRPSLPRLLKVGIASTISWILWSLFSIEFHLPLFGIDF
jgi:hypothetical protein